MTNPSDKKPSTEEELRKKQGALASLAAVQRSRKLETATPRSDPRDAAMHRANVGVESEELRRKQLDNKTIEHDHEDRKANREMRFKYSSWVFYYLVWYSLFVGWVVLLSADARTGFKLDPEVLKYLVGSTAVSAIGLVAAVTTGLFGKK